MQQSGSTPAARTAGATARRRLGVAAAWLAAVLVAGSVTGWAVSAVGGQGGGSVLSEAEVDRRLAALTTTAPSPPATATPTATPTAAPSPTDAPPVTDPAVVARAWDVEGGSVGVACRGTVIELQYATPADGWAVEVKQAGPDEVEVELRSDDDSTSVRAACAGDGTPQLHGDGDDDGSSGPDDD